MFWAYLAPVWIFGAASHFFYQWSGGARLLGLLFPHNESVWEHGKLGFWPLCLALLLRGAVLESGWPSVWRAMAAAVLFCLLHVSGLFYTYTGAFGAWSVLPADIGIFLWSSAHGLGLGWRLLGEQTSQAQGALSAAALALATFFLLYFSVRPPRLPLFIDYSSQKSRRRGGR